MSRLLRHLKKFTSNSKTGDKQEHRRSRLAIESLESRTLLAASVLADAPNVEFEIVENWTSGHSAELVLVNDEAVSYTDWQLEFDYVGTINSLWNAEVENLGGGRYRVTVPSWDRALGAGESLAIGFVASGFGAQPTNFVFIADGMTPPTDEGGDGEEMTTTAVCLLRLMRPTSPASMH